MNARCGLSSSKDKSRLCMARRGPPWHLSSVSPLSEKRAGVGEAREEGDRHVGHIGRHKHGVEDTRGGLSSEDEP